MSGAHKSVASVDAAALARCGRIFWYGMQAGQRSFANVANAAALSAEGRIAVHSRSRGMRVY